MNDTIYALQAELGPTLFTLILGILVLIAGYVIAKIIESLVRKGLKRTSLDERIASSVAPEDRSGSGIRTEHYISRGVFWLLMLLTLIAFFEVVNLTGVSSSLGGLVQQILAFLPKLLGALILTVVAYVVAALVRMLVTKGLQAIDLDRRIDEAGEGESYGGPNASDQPMADTASVASSATEDPAARSTSLAKTLGDAAFYFILLLFLPAILDALDLGGILAPIEGMVNEILAFLPNLLTAAIILVVGVFVARILRQIVTNLLAAVGLDRLGERVGVARALGSQQLSGLVGLIVYILVLIPVIVAALQALQIDAVTRPASNLLSTFLEAIPALFGAALILVIAYVVGRLVASLVASVLEGVGFNRLFTRLGFDAERAAPAAEGEMDTRTPSGIVGTIVVVAVMLFAATEAADMLGFGGLASLIAGFTVLAGRVLLGLVIFGVGLYLANLAYAAVRESGGRQAILLAVTARVAILVLAGAMALRQMGLADSIINLAFGLVLGAVAIAAAIAFGIGGREVAREQLEKLRDQLDDADGGDVPSTLKPKPEATPEPPRSI